MARSASDEATQGNVKNACRATRDRRAAESRPATAMDARAEQPSRRPPRPYAGAAAPGEATPPCAADHATGFSRKRRTSINARSSK